MFAETSNIFEAAWHDDCCSNTHSIHGYGSIDSKGAQPHRVYGMHEHDGLRHAKRIYPFEQHYGNAEDPLQYIFPVSIAR